MTTVLSLGRIDALVACPRTGRRQLETVNLVRLFALLVLGLVTTRWALAHKWLPSGDAFGLDSGIRSCAGGM